jgi:hypothetical protein
MTDGWRDPQEPELPDPPALTGDEWIHVLAIFGETLGPPFAHSFNRMPIGHPSPDCSCCASIMEKSGRYIEDLDGLGLGR